ncbi:DUF417 family protein [Rufibacter glacialis]|uniref:DUF417 domain-containing protein n=1 Tax=Rufibacter glacialis TaxID=1259555 RepID=A0A5M8QDX0_9BACT|nr:DUF417 family protein [Rufibacter glacialis]KAA6434237.1 DUF417 domain-containing protein [Rufibacter glacialis]GGK68010.1 membrane protein [Rufibacter glacialis]
MKDSTYKFLQVVADAQLTFIHFTRIAIFLVMAWIGGLKAFQYEADGIVPFVANSPFMSFFYSKDAPEYQQYKNKEGEVVPENITWHQENNTYTFSYGLGAVIITIGLLTLFGIFNAKLGLIGGLLTAGMSVVTLSFLITTPETFVPNLGGPDHGFPYLSAAGRLVIKDIIMLGAGLVVASDAARTLLRSQRPASLAKA